ncbi:hypothetical protein STENM327S_06744 [Streptomyces tendae]
MPVYDSTRNAQPTVYVRYDNGLLRFRRYYQSWVDPRGGRRKGRHMSPAPVRGRPPRDLEAPRDLARGWYVAERSTRVGRRPRPAVVAGTEVVVWRTGDGAAVVMDRFCPRRGPHWSWAGWWTGICDARSATGGSTGRGPAWPPRPPGACHAAPRPGSTPPGRGSATSGPGGARRYPSTRRPDFPHLGPTSPAHRRYRFAFDTNATARRVLENGFDLPGFQVVRGGVAGDLRLTWDAEENKHTMGARITTDSIALPGPLAGAPEVWDGSACTCARRPRTRC